MLTRMNWEIWEDKHDNSITLIAAGRPHYGTIKSELMHQFETFGHNDEEHFTAAAIKRNELYGWEPYKKPEREPLGKVKYQKRIRK